jgi:dipeptidyl aminopeptidase/acylaminoacyl peptidase
MLLALLAFPGCNLARLVSDDELNSVSLGEMVRIFYPSGRGKIEAYLFRPEAAGPSPLVILLHGHSISGRGAVQMLRAAEALSKELCFTTMAISLPGYGATETPPAPITAVTRQAVLDGPVLISGAYDLEQLYRESANFWLRALLNPEREVSPKFVNLITDPSRWHAPTLIMHGAQDKLIPAQQSWQLQQKLQAVGTTTRLVLYPDQGHLVPLRISKEATVSFFKEVAGRACTAPDSAA